MYDAFEYKGNGFRFDMTPSPIPMRYMRLPDGLRLAQLNATETRYLWEEIYGRRVYLRHGLGIQDGDCVVDVGANIGLFSRWAAQQAQHLRIHALEPIPEVAAVLAENLASLAGCSVHRLGLGRSAGSATFRYYPRATGWSSCQTADHAGLDRALHAYASQRERPVWLRAAAASHRLFSWLTRGLYRCETRVCTLTTLSDFMQAQRLARIDLLKIDVEGSELDVLSGIADTDWPRIQQITLETDTPRLASIIQRLEQRGYRVMAEVPDMLSGTHYRHVYASRDRNRGMTGLH